MDDCARQIDPEKHRIHSISKLRSVLYQASWRLNKSKETELAHVPAIWSNSPDWLSPGYGQTAQTHLRLACNRNRFIWLIPFSADQPRPSSQPRYLPFYLHLSFRSFFQRILKYPSFISPASVSLHRETLTLYIINEQSLFRFRFTESESGN